MSAGKKHSNETHMDVGEALYSISLNLTESSSPDLLQKFIGPHEEKDGGAMPDDGIICTTGGYYRVAEDKSTGNRIALFSFSYDKLRGYYNAEDDIVLGATDGVYPVAFQKVPSFGAPRGSELRTRISRHHYELQKGFKEELNLYGADLTGLFNAEADPDKKDPVVMKFGNTQLSYGVYENNDGQWEVRRRIREKQSDEEEREAIVGIDKAGSGSLIDKILSDGSSLGVFPSKEEAMAKMVLDFNKRGDRRWNAESFLDAAEIAQAPIKSARKTLTQQMVSFFKKRSLGELVFIGGMALVTLPFSGKVKLAQLGAAAVGVASAYAGKFGQQLFESSFSSLDKFKFWKRDADKNVASAQAAPRADYDDYIRSDNNNKARWCPLMQDGVADDLRLLTSAEADVKPEDARFTAPLNNGHDSALDWAGLQIPTIQNNAFKAIATPLNTQTMSYYYLMGAVAVTHTGQDKSRNVYITMRPDMKASEQSFVKPEVEAMMKHGHILHVCQDQGGDIKINTVSAETMVDDMKEILSIETESDRHAAAAVRHIKWLFGQKYEQKSAIDIQHDLSDMYMAATMGDDLNGVMAVKHPPQTLGPNPTQEDMDQFSAAKGKARDEFMRARNITRGFANVSIPHLKPILKEMDLVRS